MNKHNYNDHKNLIEALLRCASLCQYCASMDLAEKDGEMNNCAKINIECATICTTAAQLVSMGSSYAKDLIRACTEVCRECAVECAQHENDHCQACAEICTHCANECSVWNG